MEGGRLLHPLSWRHIRSVLLLPATVTLVVPAALLARSGGVRLGGALPLGWRIVAVAAGALSIAAGARLVAETVGLFARDGRGTLAPWDPPTRLVVRGPYRRVRNPMIGGVIAILVGESLLLASPALALWAAGFAAANLLLIPLHEEPRLARRFGGEYDAYARHVPRWIPRRRPWSPPAGNEPPTT